MWASRGAMPPDSPSVSATASGTLNPNAVTNFRFFTVVVLGRGRGATAHTFCPALPPQFFHRLLIIATDDTLFIWHSGARPPRFFWLEVPPLVLQVKNLCQKRNDFCPRKQTRKGKNDLRPKTKMAKTIKNCHFPQRKRKQISIGLHKLRLRTNIV